MVEGVPFGPDMVETKVSCPVILKFAAVLLILVCAAVKRISVKPPIC